MSDNEIISKHDVMGVYRRQAKRYDVTANFYYLIGVREWAYRQRAVDALGMRPRDTVVEIGLRHGSQLRLAAGGGLLWLPRTQRKPPDCRLTAGQPNHHRSPLYIDSSGASFRQAI